MKIRGNWCCRIVVRRGITIASRQRSLNPSKRLWVTYKFRTVEVNTEVGYLVSVAEAAPFHFQNRKSQTCTNASQIELEK